MAYNNWGQPGSDQQQYGSANWGDQNQGGDYAYDMNPGGDFGQEQQFQSFDYASQQQQPVQPPYVPQQPRYFTPGLSIMTPAAPEDTISGGGDFGSTDEEPPLLEELGINPDAILQKTLTVLNPMRRPDPSLLQDTDLAGPLVFCLAFGGFLLLSGKVHFGYIYGIGMLGCAALYGLLNAMSMAGVAFGVVISVLGYCLLPMVGLAGVGVLLSLRGFVGLALTMFTVMWCAAAASKLFVTALAMDHQQPLVAYPCALLYAVFALITIF